MHKHTPEKTLPTLPLRITRRQRYLQVFPCGLCDARHGMPPCFRFFLGRSLIRPRRLQQLVGASKIRGNVRPSVGRLIRRVEFVAAVLAVDSLTKKSDRCSETAAANGTTNGKVSETSSATGRTVGSLLALAIIGTLRSPIITLF